MTPPIYLKLSMILTLSRALDTAQRTVRPIRSLRAALRRRNPRGDDGWERAPDRYTARGRETIDRIRDLSLRVAQSPRIYAAGDPPPRRGEPALYFGEVTREELADLLFIFFCEATALKYLDRKGRKGPPEADTRKTQWYTQMAAHVRSAYGDGPRVDDPRAGRSDFVAYRPRSVAP